MFRRSRPAARGSSPGRNRGLPALLFLAALFLCISPAPASAVDTPSGSPDYLERTLRPRWRLETIDVVLSEIERVIDRPVQASAGVFEDRRIEVILIERKKLPVSRILALLEENYDLHCIAEPLRIVVETRAEERMRRRRPVNLDLRDYGIFFRSSPASGRIRTHSNDESDGSSPYDFGSDDEDETELPVGLLEELEQLDEEGFVDAETRGTGALLLRLTPEEEQTVRGVLEDFVTAKLAQTRFDVHFGWLPGSAETRGGVVSGESARAVAGSLIDPRVLRLAATEGKSTYAQSGAAVRTVTDLDVNQAGRYPVVDPVVTTTFAGASLWLHVSTGKEHALLSFEANWSTLVGERTSATVRTPPVIQPGSSSTTVKEGESRSSSLHAEVIPGNQVRIESRPVGLWDAIGEVFLPRGSGLVLLGVVEGRSAAIVFEEVVR